MVMQTDFQLQANVLDELADDPSLVPSDIAVAVRDGVVTLSGDVDSLAKQNAAIRAAQRVIGVRAVAADLRVRLADDKRRTDADLAHDAVNALTWDTEVPEKTIAACVQDGWIWLVGEAEWQYQRLAAQRAVENIAGLKGLTNIVRIRRHSAAPALKSHIDRAIARHAELHDRDIRVETNGTAVAIAGHVRSWREREAVEEAVWSAPGVTSVDDRVDISV
jgi:osmotically-inducible protein OsmY